MKKVLFLIILFVVFSIFLFFFSLNFLNESIDNYSWTKAICNETHCQDYEIVCNGKNTVSQTPITGAIIEVPENWEDLRDEESKKQSCK
jgi:hypothetical protein